MFKKYFLSELDGVHSCGSCGVEGPTELPSRKVLWVSIPFGKCFIVTPSSKAARLGNTLDLSSEGQESVCASPGCDWDREDLGTFHRWVLLAVWRPGQLLQFSARLSLTLLIVTISCQLISVTPWWKPQLLAPPSHKSHTLWTPPSSDGKYFLNIPNMCELPLGPYCLSTAA